MAKIKELIPGKLLKGTKLTPIKYVKHKKSSQVWLFSCSCGGTKELEVRAVGKTLYKTKSCGCQDRVNRYKHLYDNITNTKKCGSSFCERSGQWLSLSEFKKQPSSLGGCSAHCKDCMRIKGTASRYKFESAEYLLQYIDINGSKCDICSRTLDIRSTEMSNTVCIDHCHASKTIRGILCTQCNAAIGLFHDDTDKLKNAIEYLTKKSS